MTWDAIHRPTRQTRPTRGGVLRDVVDEANRRRDGVLPTDLPGVAETFADELALVSALQLRWHTRLAGRIERALMDQPMELETAVLLAWRSTAQDLVGVRQILDRYVERPTSAAMGQALATAQQKDWVLMAAMAGRASAADAAALRVGRRLEAKARQAYRPAATPVAVAAARHESLLDRLRTRLAG